MRAAAKDEYAPDSPGLLIMSAALLSVGAIGWATSAIMGDALAVQALVAILGTALWMVGCWWKWRHWQAHQRLPALLRKNLTGALRAPLPRGSVRTSRHRFGGVLKPGPPRTVTVKATGLPVLDAAVERDLLHTVGALCGARYEVDHRHSQEGRKFVLREKVPEAEAKLTPRQQTEKRILEAAAEVFPKSSPRVECVWDDDDDDFLREVTITEIPGMELSLVGKRRQTLQKLRTRLPQGNFTPEVDPREDSITFRRSKPLPAMVVAPSAHASPLRSDKEYRRFNVPLGLGDEGRQATWTPVDDAHLLISGGTGGGKTIAEHGVIQRLAQAAWRIWLVDGKQIEFIGYRDWPNVEFLAQDVDSQIRVLHQAHETMMARYKLIREGRVNVADLDPIALIVDELTSLLQLIDQRYQETKGKGMPTKHPVLKWVSNIARLGRSAKIHLVVGLQRPDAAIMGGELRDNFGGRISLGRLRQDGSIMMWDDPAVGVQVPPVKGRAISYIDGRPTMIQGTYTANPDTNHPDYHPGMIEAARPAHLVYTRKHVAEVTAEVDDDGTEIPVSWAQLLQAEILNPDKTPVVFDPVSSDESKALREAPATDATEGDIDTLQTGESFQEAIGLFAYDPCARLAYGRSVATRLLEFAGPRQQPAPPQPARPPAPEQQGPSVSEGKTAELRHVAEGHYVLIEELGTALMVSACEPSPDDPDTYTIEGYTDDGESLTAELPANTTVELFDVLESTQ
jgi:hypothetical protein